MYQPQIVTNTCSAVLRKMLLLKLPKTAFSVSLLKHNSISITVRSIGFTHSEDIFTIVDWKFRRKVLKNTDDCILFEPTIDYNPSEKFIQNDETILNMMQFTKSCKLNVNDENQRTKLNELSHSFNEKCLQQSEDWSIDKFIQYDKRMLSFIQFTDSCELNQITENQRNKLLNEFDKKCLNHSAKWIIDQNLFVLDMLDSLHPIKRKFSIVTPKYCLWYLEEIPMGQKLQLLHYLAYSKVPLSESDQSIIINILDANLDSLSLVEASFFYSALVRCECQAIEKYTNQVRRIINHLKRRKLQDENQLVVSSAVKAIRKLSTQSHINDLKRLQVRLVPLVEQADIFQLTHFAQLGLPQRVFNPKLFQLVIERSLHLIRTEPQSFRIKDVEMILLVIATYRFTTINKAEDHFCKEVQPFLKESLDTRYPLDLIQCIASLAVRGTVDHELIDWALKYGQNTNITANNVPHLLLIDSFAKVNLKNVYNSTVLSDEICCKLESKVKTKIHGCYDWKMQEDLMKMFQVKNHYAANFKTIPYNDPNIIFIYNRQTQKTVEFVQPNKCGSIIYACDLFNNEPDLVAFAIVTYGKMSTLYSIDSSIVIGRLQMRIDQLKLLGFHVVTWNVSQYKWILADWEGKQQQLHDRLRKSDIQLFDGEKNEKRDSIK